MHGWSSPSSTRTTDLTATILCEAGLVPKPGVVDNAVYVDGYRVDSPPTLEQTYDLQKRPICSKPALDAIH